MYNGVNSSSYVHCVVPSSHLQKCTFVELPVHTIVIDNFPKPEACGYSLAVPSFNPHMSFPKDSCNDSLELSLNTRIITPI